MKCTINQSRVRSRNSLFHLGFANIVRSKKLLSNILILFKGLLETFVGLGLSAGPGIGGILFAVIVYSY